MSALKCRPHIPGFYVSIKAQIGYWRGRRVYVEDKVIPGYSAL